MVDRRYKIDNLENLPWYLDKIGSVFQLSGLLFSGQGQTFVLYMPDSNIDTLTEIDNISVEEWCAILQQSDDPLILIENKKPWVRKAEYIISGFVQQKVWVRDGLRCMYCNRKMGEVQLTVDHFMPLELGGENNQRNYLTACRKCNKDKGSIHPQDFCMKKGYDYQYLVSYLKNIANY